MVMLTRDMLDGRAQELIEYMLESFDEGDFPKDEMDMTNIDDLRFGAQRLFLDSEYEKYVKSISNRALSMWQMRAVHNDDFDKDNAVREVLGYIDDSEDFEEDALLQHCRDYLDWHEFTRLYEDTLYNAVSEKIVESCQEMSRG